MTTALVILHMLKDIIDGRLANIAAKEIIDPIASLPDQARQHQGWIVLYGNDDISRATSSWTCSANMHGGDVRRRSHRPALTPERRPCRLQALLLRFHGDGPRHHLPRPRGRTHGHRRPTHRLLLPTHLLRLRALARGRALARTWLPSRCHPSSRTSQAMTPACFGDGPAHARCRAGPADRCATRSASPVHPSCGRSPHARSIHASTCARSLLRKLAASIQHQPRPRSKSVASACYGMCYEK